MTWMWTVLGFRSFDIKFLKVKLNHLENLISAFSYPPSTSWSLCPPPLPEDIRHKKTLCGQESDAAFIWFESHLSVSFTPPLTHPSEANQGVSWPHLFSLLQLLFLVTFSIWLNLCLTKEFFFPIKNAPSDWGLGKTVNSNVWHTAYKDSKALIFIILVIRE